MKVLFLENKKSIERLVGPISLSNLDIEFNGEMRYAFRFYKLREYDFIINFNYSNPLHIKMIEYARSFGITTCLLQDGVYDWANAYINNSIPLYNIIFHDIFIFFGTDREKKLLEKNLIKTNCLLKYVPSYIRAGVVSMKDKKYDFLITTANTAYFNEAEFHSLVLIIKLTIENMVCNGFSYKVRIFDKKLLDAINIGLNIENDVDDSFGNAISNVSAIITTKSTVIYEALCSNLPVGELIYRNTPILSSAAWCIHSAVDFYDTFTSMLAKEPYRMKYQEHFFQENISNSSEIDVDHLFSNVKINDVLKRKIISLVKLMVCR